MNVVGASTDQEQVGLVGQPPHQWQSCRKERDLEAVEINSILRRCRHPILSHVGGREYAAAVDHKSRENVLSGCMTGIGGCYTRDGAICRKSRRISGGDGQGADGESERPRVYPR